MFSRNAKSSYSWLEKGKEWNINNICFTKSVSLITAIISDGSIFAAAAKGNVNGELFKEFLKELKNFIELDLAADLWNWLVLIDNVPTYHSISVKKYVEKEKFNIAFIPAYSPEWAQVEKYFSLLKKIVLHKADTKMINLVSPISTSLIGKSMNCISNGTVANIWSSLFDELRSWVDHISDFI